MLRQTSDKSIKFLLTHQNELTNILLGVGSIFLNFWLTATIKTDTKTQRSQSGPSSSTSALYQQMGIGSLKQTHLSTAQQLTLQGQHGNYNFGTHSPDFIRAIVTLYLAMSLLHTVHSRMKSVFFESQQKRIKIGTLVVVLCIVALAVLDIVVVNDVILINNNDAHISALGVNDVYTSGAGTTGKNRNKEFQLYLDYLISSVVLGYRWISIVFLISSLWTRDLRPLIKGKKVVRIQADTPTVSDVQRIPIIQDVLNKPKKKGRQQQVPKNNKKTNSTQLAAPQKLRTNSISSKSSHQPILNQISQFSDVQRPPAPSTEAETKVTKFTFSQQQVEKRRSRKTRSESQTHQQNYVDSDLEVLRSSSEMTKLRNKFEFKRERDFHLIIHGHSFEFDLSTPKGHFHFETNSIQEFNTKVDDISNLNNWHDWIMLNVKIHFWKDAFQRLKSASAKNIVKGELVKLISQYSLLLINHQQNFGTPMVEID